MKTGHDMDLDPPIWVKKSQNWPYGPTFIEDKGLSMETALMLGEVIRLKGKKSLKAKICESGFITSW
jgi:hypothetical protein